VWLRLVLGAVYLGMGLGQLASWSDMPAILGAYRLVPEPLLPAFAAALIIAELTCGLWFAVRPRSRAAAPVWIYTAVSVVWAVLAVQAYLRGLPIENCGCFGRYLTQRLSLFVVAQDALLLIYAALLLRGLRAAPRRPTVREEAR
jgi:hypothetical protein